MIALIQRVSRADVSIDDVSVASIGGGILAFVCAQPRDTLAEVDRMIEKICSFRIFSDESGKMNRSLRDCAGALLLVPQFTLAADTARANRPSFTRAAPPEIARGLFDELVKRASVAHTVVGAGIFGADMQISLVNDGPVTFWLEIDAPMVAA